MYVSVVVNRSNESLNKSFTYLVPANDEPNVQLYKRVIVPFGKNNTLVSGIIVKIIEGKVEYKNIKKIAQIVDRDPFISEAEADIAREVSRLTGANFVDSLKLFFPPVTFDSIISGYKKITDFEDDALFKNGILLDDEICEDDKNKIEKWLNKKYIKRYYRLKDEPKIKTENILFATGLKEENLTEKQKYCLEKIKENNFTKTRFTKETSVSISVVDTLIKKGLVEIRTVEAEEERKNYNAYNKFQLNSMQKKVLDEIKSDYEAGLQNNFLIQGVTGSGKTEIYLQLVEYVLNRGKNAIILVPEIGLTPQTVARFKGRFKEDIAIIHSRLNRNERFREWMKIKNGEVRIVVGARSAIFSPLKNVGIIVIDEEHDNSYTSSKTPKYKTVDVAKYIAKRENAILLLGSATPSIDTFYKGRRGEYKILQLLERANGKKAPDIEVVDMSKELEYGNTSIFSHLLYDAILTNLGKKEQTILFLNRRGYSGFVSCRTCGEAIKCEKCDVSMTYHKRQNLLICHYCGRTKKLPDRCPVCGSEKIKEFGIGTEQVQEITKRTFPQARVARMDRDTTTKKNSHLNIYNAMNNNNIDILIGTQMLAKGLDFKNVTLVGILAADLSLQLPDYRAPEITYSTISQVAGRSGRGDLEGRVILQTYNPNHYAIKAAVDSSFEEFYQKEILIREEFKYPPFYRIILIRSEDKDNIRAYNRLKDIYDKFMLKVNIQILDVVALHPNPSPISKINDIYRWQFIIKVAPKEKEKVLDILKNFGKTDVTIEVDPINMM